MKKYIALLLACMMLICFTGCAAAPANETGGNADTAKEPNLQEIQTAIADKLGITPNAMNTEIMVGMYGFPADGIAESASFTVDGPVFREEIFMLKATDETNADAIAEKVQKRLDDLKKQSQSYAPESAAILAECSVMRNGNYIAMFFSESRADMETVYNSYF